MNLAILKNDAAAKIGPLAETVRKLTGQLAHLRQRLETERGNVGKREADLESLKAAASSYLAENTFPTFKVRLKRATENLSAARESVVLFETDLIPRTEKGLQEAHEKLAQAFTTTCATARADCKASMAEKLGVIVAEHDAFMAAIAELGKTYGTASRSEPPKIAHVRLAEVKYTLTGRRWLTLKRTPVAPAASATMPAAAVSAAPEAPESPRTPEVGESVTSDAPQPPEAAAPVNAAASRARVLLRFTGDAGDIAPTPVEPLPDAAPADLDPYPLPPDADGPDLDAGQSESDDGDVEGGDVEAEAPGPSPTPAE